MHQNVGVCVHAVRLARWRASGHLHACPAPPFEAARAYRAERCSHSARSSTTGNSSASHCRRSAFNGDQSWNGAARLQYAGRSGVLIACTGFNGLRRTRQMQRVAGAYRRG